MAALGVYLQPFGFGVFHVSSCEFTGEHGQSELPVFGSQEAGTQKRFNLPRLGPAAGSFPLGATDVCFWNLLPDLNVNSVSGRTHRLLTESLLPVTLFHY